VWVLSEASRDERVVQPDVCIRVSITEVCYTLCVHTLFVKESKKQYYMQKDMKNRFNSKKARCRSVQNILPFRLQSEDLDI
jgi:hypothetical protein